MYREIYGGFLLRVFIRKKSKRKNPNRKLVGVSRGEKCVYERKSKKKYMPCVFRKKSERKNPNRKPVGVSRGEKCVYERKSKRKNTCRVFMERKVSGKTHSGSLLLGCKEKNGRGRKDASGKTHGVGAGREKQAEKPTLEAYC